MYLNLIALALLLLLPMGAQALSKGHNPAPAPASNSLITTFKGMTSCPTGPILISKQKITNPNGACLQYIANDLPKGCALPEIRIEDSEIGPCKGHGIELGGQSNVSVLRNYIHDTISPIQSERQLMGLSIWGSDRINIQSNYIENVTTGVFAENVKKIIVDNNQFKNIIGPSVCWHWDAARDAKNPTAAIGFSQKDANGINIGKVFPTSDGDNPLAWNKCLILGANGAVDGALGNDGSKGQIIQFVHVSGPGIKITNNRAENIPGKSWTEDLINISGCNGDPSDPILIQGNTFRGGGWLHDRTTADGMARNSPNTPPLYTYSGGGIIIGDGWAGPSSYFIVKDNQLFDPGQYGIQISLANHVTFQNNTVYGKQQPFTNTGLIASECGGKFESSDPQYNKDTHHNTIQNNEIFWIRGSPFWNDAGAFTDAYAKDCEHPTECSTTCSENHYHSAAAELKYNAMLKGADPVYKIVDPDFKKSFSGNKNAVSGLTTPNRNVGPNLPIVDTGPVGSLFNTVKGKFSNLFNSDPPANASPTPTPAPGVNQPVVPLTPTGGFFFASNPSSNSSPMIPTSPSNSSSDPIESSAKSTSSSLAIPPASLGLGFSTAVTSPTPAAQIQLALSGNSPEISAPLGSAIPVDANQSLKCISLYNAILAANARWHQDFNTSKCAAILEEINHFQMSADCGALKLVDLNSSIQSKILATSYLHASVNDLMKAILSNEITHDTQDLSTQCRNLSTVTGPSAPTPIISPPSNDSSSGSGAVGGFAK